MKASRLFLAVSVMSGMLALIADPNVAYTVDATVSEALVLDGEYVIDVAGEVTVVYSGTISGTGPLRKTGAGTLVLKPADGDNTFTEGVQISQGVVRADTAGALGSGEIFLDGTMTGKDNSKRTYGLQRQIYFNADGATFPNRIRIEGYDGHAGYSYLQAFIRTDVKTVLTGDIDLSALNQYTAGCNANISCGTSVPSSALLHFTKGLSWPGKTLRVNAYGDVRFDGPVVLGSMTIGYNSALGGTITLASSENQISSISLNRAKILAASDSVLGVARFLVTRGFSSQTYSALDLNGRNQSLASLQYDSGSAKNYYSDKSVYVNSASPVVLRLVGEETSRTSYQTLSGKVSLVVDASGYPSFVQTFAARAHTTSGTLSVSNGTLAVTLGATFKNVGEIHVGENGTLTADSVSALPEMFIGVTNMVVDGRMSFGDNITAPFADKSVDMALGADAELTLPDSMVLRVKSLTVAGTRIPNRTRFGVGGEVLTQLKGGSIVVDDGSAEIVNAMWTGSGSSTSIAVADNWSTAPELPNLSDMVTFAEFAAGGAEASVDRAVSFHGIRLSASEGFAFVKASDNASISLGAGGLSVAQPAEGASPVYAFGVPLVTENQQELNVSAGASVRADAGLRDISGGRIDKKGGGEFSISGDSILSGALVHNEGTLRFSGEVGAPSGVSQGKATKFGVSTITVPGNIDGLVTILDGVTFHKPIWTAGRGSVDDKNVNWLQFGAASTNVFKEDAVFHTDVGYLNLDSDSALVFEKGADFASTVNFCNGTLIVKGGQVKAVTGNGMYLRRGSIRLETEGNQITLRGRSVRKAEFMVDFAITNRFLEFDTDYPQIYLYGTRQHCTTFRATSGVKIWGGDKPAKIIISDGAGTEDTSYMYGSIDGHVSFRQATANTFSIYSDSKSTGDLEVSKGVLQLAAIRKSNGTVESIGAWRHGTNIVVNGNGVFATTVSDQLNRKHTVVKVSDNGVLRIPEGVRQVVRELHVDGVRVPRGVYGGVDAPSDVDKTYAQHFDGAGTIRVFCAMTVVLR